MLPPAKLAVSLMDGTTLATGVEYPKGDPENSLTWEEVITKFAGLTAGILDRDEVGHAVRDRLGRYGRDGFRPAILGDPPADDRDGRIVFAAGASDNQERAGGGGEAVKHG